MGQSLNQRVALPIIPAYILEMRFLAFDLRLIKLEVG
jgi:hypothetical protein